MPYMVGVLLLFGVVLTVGFHIKDSLGTTSYANIEVDNVELSESHFKANMIHLSSGNSFRKYEYKIEGDGLYITVWSGLVNKKYSAGEMNIQIENDLKNVNLVYLIDGKRKKMIYNKP